MKILFVKKWDSFRLTGKSLSQQVETLAQPESQYSKNTVKQQRNTWKAHGDFSLPLNGWMLTRRGPLGMVYPRLHNAGDSRWSSMEPLCHLNRPDRARCTVLGLHFMGPPVVEPGCVGHNRDERPAPREKGLIGTKPRGGGTVMLQDREQNVCWPFQLHF